jgi:hypothetical protein
VNESTLINESFLFSPRILSNSPIDVIIGRSTIKENNLALKLPSGFFQEAFIKNNSKLFINQEPVVSSDLNQALPTRLPAVIPATLRLPKRVRFTEISEKPCTDHICGCQLNSGLQPEEVTRTGALKNKVEVAINRTCDGISTPTSIGKEPCDGISKSLTITGPRVGKVLSEGGNTSLTDTRGHTLTAVAQTHTVLRHAAELQPYNLDDGIILGCLFSSLPLSSLSETPNLENTVFALTDSHAIKSTIKKNFIDDDGISDYHDSFMPWAPDQQTNIGLIGIDHRWMFIFIYLSLTVLRSVRVLSETRFSI